MSKFTIDIDYDDSAIQSALTRLLQTGRDLRPVFNDIGEYLLAEHERRWEEGIGPNGFAWAELLDATWEKKRKNNEAYPLFGNPAQMLTGAAYNASADALELVIPSDIAKYHQFGTKHMPARELLGINADDEAEILRLLQKHIENAWDD